MSDIPVDDVVTRTERYERRRNAFDRWQRRFLILGALVDAFFGSLLYFLPERTTTGFHLVVPPEGVGTIWVQLVGMLLMTMAVIYLYASLDPNRHLGIVVISVVGRVWGVGVYLYFVLALGAPPAFYTFVGLDGILFLLHIWALGPDRWSRVKSAFRVQDLHP